MHLAGERAVSGFSQPQTSQSSVEQRPQSQVRVTASPDVRVGTLGMLFLSGFAATGMLYLALVFCVNPSRDFAFGPTFFPAVRSDYRSEKIALFQAFLNEGPAEGLVLGSSRSMLLNGTRMRGLSGVPFFNFGLASAKGEDFLAVLRWVALKQGHMPKHVIIGVDVESLRDTQAHGDSIHPLRELAVGSPPAIDRAKTMFRRILAWSYARDTAFSAYLWAVPRPSAVSFKTDGTMRYDVRDAARHAGTFLPAAENSAGCIADCRAKIETTNSLSPVQIAFLKQAVREAVDGGATVTIWLTGPHPVTAEHMASGTSYLRLVDEANAVLRGLSGPAETFDLHDENAYGGDVSRWYDCNHFDDTHAERIEKILLRPATAHAQELNRGF